MWLFAFESTVSELTPICTARLSTFKQAFRGCVSVLKSNKLFPLYIFSLNPLTNLNRCDIIPLVDIIFADVAELADALDSGSSESNFIWVQVPSSAPVPRSAIALLGNFTLWGFFNFCRIGGEDLADKNTGRKIIAQNKKAYHDYFVDEKYEAGIQLFGTEVKSLRKGQVNLKDSYCEINGGEIFATGIHISPYEQGNIFNRDPLRDRKLLMHKREIMKLHGLVGQKGFSIIPLSLYFSGSYVKVELGLCRGKKLYDKRDSQAKKDSDRNIERYSKNKNADF